MTTAQTKPRTIAILQARMGSTRLPGKVLLPAAGKPLIEHMIERVRRAKTLDGLWLATSVDTVNDPLADCVDALGVPVFRGDENDVLSRYATVAQQAQADVVVRLTGDCPLHDPDVIDETVGIMLSRLDEIDYASNSLQATYPDGLDVEVFTRAALDRAQREASTQLQREHVTPFIHRYQDGPGPFRVLHVHGRADFSHLRWTVDEPADYEFVRRIFDTLYPVRPDFGWLDVLALLTRQPELLTYNSHIVRNEGYIKALHSQISESP